MAATTASFQDAELIPLPVEDWAFVPFAVRTSFAVRWGGVLDPSQPSLKLEVQGIKPLNFAASLTAISGFIEVRVVCERITTVSGLIPPCVVGGVALLDCR